MAQPRIREFRFRESNYRAPFLNAFEQHKCITTAAPALRGLQSDGGRHGRNDGKLDQVGALTAVLNAIGPSEAEDLFRTCLSGVEREVDGVWSTVWNEHDADVAFDDISAGLTFVLVARIILMNLHTYLARPIVKIDDKGEPALDFTSAELPNGLSWLLRPVENRMCLFESLKDATLDLADIALMNDQLSVTAENQSRARKAAQQEAERKQR